MNVCNSKLLGNVLQDLSKCSIWTVDNTMDKTRKAQSINEGYDNTCNASENFESVKLH